MKCQRDHVALGVRYIFCYFLEDSSQMFLELGFLCFISSIDWRGCRRTLAVATGCHGPLFFILIVQREIMSLTLCKFSVWQPRLALHEIVDDKMSIPIKWGSEFSYVFFPLDLDLELSLNKIIEVCFQLRVTVKKKQLSTWVWYLPWVQVSEFSN